MIEVNHYYCSTSQQQMSCLVYQQDDVADIKYLFECTVNRKIPLSFIFVLQKMENASRVTKTIKIVIETATIIVLARPCLSSTMKHLRFKIYTWYLTINESDNIDFTNY